MSTLILAVAWPAAPGIEALSRAFWIQQAISAVGTLVFIRGVISLAARRSRARPTTLLRFPTRR